METLTSTHPFEKAGLGKAPFRVLGMHQKIFSIPGGPSKPGGTCDYCSTGILNCFTVRSADGKEFVVGSDCVRKTTKEGKLLTDVQRLKREHDRKKRQEKEHIYRLRILAQYDELMGNDAEVVRLQSLPHPKIEGKTLYDYLTWLRINAGTAALDVAMQAIPQKLAA